MGSSFQEDFCEHIEDTYYAVFPSQQNSASAKEIADVVHRLMKTNVPEFESDIWNYLKFGFERHILCEYVCHRYWKMIYK